MGNEQDFVDLHKALRNELEPDGPAEEEAVLGIAGLYWKKRRLTMVHSSPTKLFLMFPLYPRQARAVGAALGNIFNRHQTKWGS
jgi:hypothetical protein